jgi:hypothetical protein
MVMTMLHRVAYTTEGTRPPPGRHDEQRTQKELQMREPVSFPAQQMAAPQNHCRNRPTSAPDTISITRKHPREEFGDEWLRRRIRGSTQICTGDGGGKNPAARIRGQLPVVSGKAD